MFGLLSKPVLKILVALGIIVLLVYYNRVDMTALAGSGRLWPWLFAAFLVMLPTFMIVSLRFKLVLDSQGIQVPFVQAIRWTMIGAFFDLAMPSSSGGDLIKAGYVAKHVGDGQRTRAVMSVIFDRMFGLLGLFSLVIMASGIGWHLLRDLPSRNMVVAFALVAFIGTLLLLRLAGSRTIYQSTLVDRFLSRNALGVPVKQLIASFNSLREKPRYLLPVLGLSIINHIFWCSSLFCIVKALDVPVDVLAGFVVFPLAIFSNVFGVAGGFGGGTVGFDLLLSKLLVISHGALIGLLFQSLSALARLAGLPFYLISPSGEREASNS